MERERREVNKEGGREIEGKEVRMKERKEERSNGKRRKA